MNKFKNGLISILIPALATISGCTGLTLGGYQPVDLSKSHYAQDIKQKADELSEEQTVESQGAAAKGYGSIGDVNNMDKRIKTIIKKDLNMGSIYSVFGDIYHQMHKK